MSLLFEDKRQNTLEFEKETPVRGKGEKTSRSSTDRHWPGNSALVWNLPGFVPYHKMWLLQRKKGQLDIFMHTEMKPCWQCFNEVMQTQRHITASVSTSAVTQRFYLLFLCALAGKNMGSCDGGSLLLPWWKETGSLPSAQDIHLSSDCSIFAALLPVPNPLEW